MVAMRPALLVALLLASCSFDLSRSPGGDRAPAREAAVDGRASDQPRDARTLDARPGERTPGEAIPKPKDAARAEAKPVDAKPFPDTKPSDGPKPLPDKKPPTDAFSQLVSWKTLSATSPAAIACLSTKFFGGGAGCSAGVIQVLWPDPSNKQVAASCSVQSTVLLHAACTGATFSGQLVAGLAAGAKHAYCPAGANVVGGGCKCATSAIASSHPLDAVPPAAEGWSCTCESNGIPTDVVALCATGISATVESFGCFPGQVLLGGGCHCQNGLLTRSEPAGTTWSCACDAGNATVYSLCAQP